MDMKFLDFEQPIAELEAKIEELRLVGDDNEINIQDEIATLEKKSRDLTESIFSNLKPWQISQVARHPLRPYFLDYVQRIFDDFEDRFLKRDVQSVLVRNLFLPWRWFQLGSAVFGRSEMSAAYYDEVLFSGGTFGDMAATGGPLIRINATDAGYGVQFSFDPDLFNIMCSDLSKFSVSRAVTASSAVPILFSSLTIRNCADSGSGLHEEGVGGRKKNYSFVD